MSASYKQRAQPKPPLAMGGPQQDWLMVKAGDLVCDQNIIQVGTDAGIEETSELLIKHHISSVPIYDSKAKVYVGFFDLHDLCTFLLILAQSNPEEKRRMKMFGKFLSNPTADGEVPPAISESPGAIERRRSSTFSISSSFTSNSSMPESPTMGRLGSMGSSGIPTRDYRPVRRRASTSSASGGGSFRLPEPMEWITPELEYHKLTRYMREKKPITTSQFMSVSIPGEPVLTELNINLILDISTANPFYTVLPETPIHQVVELFSMGTHRVAVTDSDGKIKGILTQSRLVEFLYNNVEELGLTQKSVVYVHPDAPVLKALGLLSRWHITSLAIVDENRTLIGNLSLGDIKYVVTKQFRHLLYGSVIALVQAVRFYQGIQEGKDRIPVFGVRPNATLRHVITKLNATNAHRVWVTTNESPLGHSPSLCFGAEPNVLNPSIVGSPSPATEMPAPMHRRHSLVIPNSLPSISARTERYRRVSFSGAFEDAVCSVISLTDVLAVIFRELPLLKRSK
ncbi:cell separation during budding [Mycoemilia scoparia]|uniref:Cell separation during budding n=1 Tax=Mycoemilia scoparia TaxID=417184 RepID=A0A9W7ZZ00_9FUNG|nr:cell separation during budding [Mycoemilia scoparia]